MRPKPAIDFNPMLWHLQTVLALSICLWLCVQSTCYASVQAYIPQDRFNLLRIDGEGSTNQHINTINDLAQGSKGFLWLATENGLVRFDGAQSRLYQHEAKNQNSLTSNYIRSLAIDDRTMWIATERGLNVMDLTTGAITVVKDTLPKLGLLEEQMVRHVIVSQNQTVYFAFEGGVGYFPKNEKSIKYLKKHPDPHQGLLSNDIRALLEDDEGNLWIGTYDKGISKYSPSHQSFVHYDFLQDNSSASCTSGIRDLAQDHKGRIWIASWNGGVCFIEYGQQSPKLTNINPHSGFEPYKINDLMIDSQGVMWAAFEKKGAAYFNEQTNEFIFFGHEPLNKKTLLYGTVRKIFEDQNQNLWFATFPKGLNYLKRSATVFKNTRQSFVNKNSLSNSAVLSTFKDSQNNIWVGTEDGLNVIDPNTHTINHYMYHPRKNALPARPVTSMTEDEHGMIWLTTWSGGATRLNPKTGEFTFFNSRDTNGYWQHNTMWKVFRDDSDELWFGTEEFGLGHYNRAENKIEYIKPENNQLQNKPGAIWDLLQAPQGNLWIGAQNGLYLYNRTTKKFVQKPDNLESLKNITVRSLLKDSDDYIWLGTQSNGLVRFTPETKEYKNIDVNSGLPHNTVTSLQEDKQGYLWATTMHGLVKIDRSKVTVKRIFRTSDGLVGDVFNRNSSHLSADGELFLGSTEGLIQFYPEQVQKESVSPNLQITDFLISNQSVDYRPQDTLLKKHITHLEELNLEWNQNMFTIIFQNVNFNFSSHTNYRYKLEGFDSEWNAVGANINRATYSNLEPGSYVFKMGIKNPTNEWQPSERTLTIKVVPPWWRSNLSYLLYGLAFAVLAYGLFRFVAIVFMNHRLNHLVEERTNELTKANQAKTVFLANMSHELRTPLNSIIGFSKRLMVKHKEDWDERTLNALDAIHRNGTHLLSLINDILDLSKIESGKMEIKIAPCNLKAIIENVVNDLKDQADKKGIEINLPEYYERQVILADDQRIAQIFSNLLSNAIKYTEKGSVSIEINERPLSDTPCCTIEVIDTGKGISEEEQAKLFQRFEQVDQQTKYIQGFGTGLGLALVYEFATLHGGTVICHSQLGKGSHFIVYIPLRSRVT